MIKQTVLRLKPSKSALFTPLLFFKEKGLGDEFLKQHKNFCIQPDGDSK
ncbi:hypothetical protein Cabys_3995 [Caldithrix abyssi DSM 13497]|uniref:Uncharacterized protein n=1 Tax=Caldithrix abyssi DSM 13497 TaxID=880073 RepID=A0A1J1CEB1_CALAY|nr:hypothetical protein Cabys_3995 [Caldithrix abyssi DSM 13497]